MKKTDVFDWAICEQRLKSHLVNCNKHLEDCILCDCVLIVGELDARLKALERCMMNKRNP